MSEFDLVSDILITVRLNRNVPRHVSPFSIRVPLTGTRTSHSWPVTSHLCPLYWSCPGPYYKQIHFMVVIFVVNYVFLYFTFTVDNEYRWNARNPGPMTARSSIVSLRTRACSDCVECMVMPSRNRSDNYEKQKIGNYGPHRFVASLADLYQISLLNKWHFGCTSFDSRSKGGLS